MSEAEKTAVVTGVSTGIGRAIAKTLIDAGWRVFGSVRKEKDAAEASAALGANFTPLLFDVTDDAAIRRAAEKVEKALGGRTLDALINNAGIAVAGPVGYLDLEDLKRQMDINVYGPIRVTQAFLPMLGADHSRRGAPGRIINMSSVAGKMASPFMGPYAMSKHALEAMSESLRRELIKHGIDVIIIGPGAIKTPIWAKADELEVDRYRNTEYFEDLSRMKDMMQAFGDQGLEAEDVGQLALHILTAEKPKTRYPILKNKFAMWTLPNLLPKRMVDKAILKRFGMTSRDA
ncbi:MAG TPA: SDR family oxidoreductase [Parvularculaceae bacterium]|nr:SDR family oxidoreductase [Parvularculaceae bacterium]